jgi:single-strand DNA-binding protein
MSNLNKVMLIGRLTKDPQLRYTPSGTAVTSFSIATNRRWRGADGEQREDTQYHDIVAWNRTGMNLAELCAEHLAKGRLVYVEGRLQTRSWEGQDGQKRKATEINAQDVQFLDSRGAGPPRGEAPDSGFDEAVPAAGAAPAGAAPAEVDPDDIPF